MTINGRLVSSFAKIIRAWSQNIEQPTTIKNLVKQVSLPVQVELKICAISFEMILRLIVSAPCGDDHGQENYRRKASETSKCQSKVVGLNCIWTPNVKKTWNRFYYRLISFAELFSCCVFKLSKSAKTNPMNIYIKTIFDPNRNFEK